MIRTRWCYSTFREPEYAESVVRGLCIVTFRSPTTTLAAIASSRLSLMSADDRLRADRYILDRYLPEHSRKNEKREISFRFLSHHHQHRLVDPARDESVKALMRVPRRSTNRESLDCIIRYQTRSFLHVTPGDGIDDALLVYRDASDRDEILLASKS